MRPNYQLLALVDPSVIGHAPQRDAATLARWMIDDASYANIKTLFAASGWTLRRFNPAIGLLLELFDEGRYSKSMPSGCLTSCAIIGFGEQLILRRFIKEDTSTTLAG